jgi:quinohemoprotein ethanol dehydrogenase
VAYRADTGEKLLDLKTGLHGGMGPPITYMIDGKQYVSLMGGTGKVIPSVGFPAPPPSATPPGLPKLLTFVLDGAPITDAGQ